MFNEEESELLRYGEEINSLPKPENIDDYIRKGMELGKKKKRRIKQRLIINVAAAMVMVVLITSVRVSPAFAEYVSKVPGLEYIVRLINYDRGIKDIVENNFVQSINASKEYDGLLFTIKDMIIDESKAVIFYSVENKSNHRFVNLQEMKFSDDRGKELIASVSWGGYNNDMNIVKKFEGSVEINFIEETVIPDVLHVSAKLKERASDNPSKSEEITLAPVWEFDIAVDKKRFEGMEKSYILNQTIEIEGQKILFQKAVITPTRIALDIEYDKNNSKKVLRFDDISIIDERGEKWGTIMNGVSGSIRDEYNETLYFQSNYFTNPKELYISGSSIRAIEKEELEVIVDSNAKILVKAPDDKLSLKFINNENKSISIGFNLVKDKILDKNYTYNVFKGELKDAKGEVYNLSSSSAGERYGENEQELEYKFKSSKKINGLIYLTIEDYPVRINGDFKVKIK